MPSKSTLLTSTHLNLLPQSITIQAGMEYGLEQLKQGRRLLILADPEDRRLSSFTGESSTIGGQTLLIAPLSHQNAAALRDQLPWLKPQVLGLRTSAGMGDRLGLATPGHVRAVQKTGGQIAPIFAQQSIREMTRTGRTPQQVMDDATWGIFQESWQNGCGADADHLKTFDDIDRCVEAGFTFFTFDPGAYVNNQAETASLGHLREMADRLPTELQIQSTGLLNKALSIETLNLGFDELTLLKAIVKYGGAVGHVVAMYHHMVKAAGSRPFEVEVSVDETDQPTTHAEHAYIASELKRLGVEWVSLAPRYIGAFEKGVDYIGNVSAFEADIAGHAAIARCFGPYKLSLHSGSDKFSIYSAAARQTRGLVHLKTAGTSYLEALRTAAAVDIDLFREIYSFARERYETDRASYHVSAELDRAQSPDQVTDWPGLLDRFDEREILHTTFGSVLTDQNPDGSLRFYDRLMGLLNANPVAYADNLEHHFIRHLEPFLSQS